MSIALGRLLGGAAAAFGGRTLVVKSYCEREFTNDPIAKQGGRSGGSSRSRVAAAAAPAFFSPSLGVAGMVAFLDLDLLWRAINMARADARVVTNATIAGVVET
jgi:hypothetical protein